MPQPALPAIPSDTSYIPPKVIDDAGEAVIPDPGEAVIPKPITYDSLPPTLAITSDTTVLIAGQVASISFFFSKLPVGFAAEAITAVGGVIRDLIETADPAVYTAIFTPDGASSGIAVISVGAGSYSDAAGNLSLIHI